MKFLPSLEVALKRRRKSKPWKIALLSALFPPLFLILAYRQRSPLYLISFVFSAAIGIGSRWLLIVTPDPVEILTFNSGQFDLSSWIFNQIFLSNYVPSLLYGCLGLWFAGHLRVFDPSNPYPYESYLIDRDIYKEQSKRAQQARYERNKNKKDKTNKKNNTKAKSESYEKENKPEWFSQLNENQKEFFDAKVNVANEYLTDFLEKYYNAIAEEVYDDNNIQTIKRKIKYLSKAYHLFQTNLSIAEGNKDKFIRREIVTDILTDNLFEDYDISDYESFLLYYNSILLANERQRVSPILSDLDEILAINNLPEILFKADFTLFINKKAERTKEYQITQLNQDFILTKDKLEEVEKMYNEIIRIQEIEENESQEENKYEEKEDTNQVEEEEQKIDEDLRSFKERLGKTERMYSEFKRNQTSEDNKSKEEIDSKKIDWTNQLTEEQKAFLDNEKTIDNETFSEFLERFYKKQVSSKPKSKPTTKTKDLFYRNVGTCSPDDLLLKSDSEIYELVKYQLLHLTRGTRTSEAGEVEYLKGLLKKLRNSSNS